VGFAASGPVKLDYKRKKKILEELGILNKKKRSR